MLLQRFEARFHKPFLFVLQVRISVWRLSGKKSKFGFHIRKDILRILHFHLRNLNFRFDFTLTTKNLQDGFDKVLWTTFTLCQICKIWLIINYGHYCWIISECCSYYIEGWNLYFYIIEDMNFGAIFFYQNFA